MRYFNSRVQLSREVAQSRHRQTAMKMKVNTPKFQMGESLSAADVLMFGIFGNRGAFAAWIAKESFAHCISATAQTSAERCCDNAQRERRSCMRKTHRKGKNETFAIQIVPMHTRTSEDTDSQAKSQRSLSKLLLHVISIFLVVQAECLQIDFDSGCRGQKSKMVQGSLEK